MLNELTVWQEAVESYDQHNYAKAFEKFQQCLGFGAKIYFNMGMIYISLNQIEDAIQEFSKAIQRDQYLAIAQFELGVSYMALGDFENALDSFTDTMESLRDNQYIDYHKIGINFKLQSFEVFFNRALCFLMMDDKENAMLDLAECDRDAKICANPGYKKMEYKSGRVIESWENGNLDRDYMAFSVQLSAIYRPPKSKIENMEPVDYLGQGKVLASIYKDDNIIGFEEPHRQAFLHRRQLSLSEPDEDRRVSRSGRMSDLNGFNRQSTFSNNKSFQKSRSTEKKFITKTGSAHCSGDPVLSKRSRRRELREATYRRPSDASFSAISNASRPSLSLDIQNYKRPSSIEGTSLVRSPRPGTPVTPLRPMYMPNSPRTEISGPSLLRSGNSNYWSPTLHQLPVISDIGPLFQDDDLRSLLSFGSVETNQLKIYCHRDSDIRKISMSKDASFEEVRQTIFTRYHLGDKQVSVVFKYEDEDKHLITIADQGDLREAISFALESQKLHIHVITQ